MKWLQPRKADFRFEPIIIKPKAVAIGHQGKSIGTGYHKDARRKPRSTQRINLSKEGY